jgi:hypothetical protein
MCSPRKYFYPFFVAVIGTSLFSLTARSSDDALNQLRQLIKAEPQLCPDDRACYCVRYTPLRRKRGRNPLFTAHRHRGTRALLTSPAGITLFGLPSGSD